MWAIQLSIWSILTNKLFKTGQNDGANTSSCSTLPPSCWRVVYPFFRPRVSFRRAFVFTCKFYRAMGEVLIDFDSNFWATDQSINWIISNQVAHTTPKRGGGRVLQLPSIGVTLAKNSIFLTVFSRYLFYQIISRTTRSTLATNATLWENPIFHISINIYETIT